MLTNVNNMSSNLLEFKSGILDILPDDLLREFCYYLTAKEIFLLCTTNTKFGSLCQNEKFWRRKLLYHSPYNRKFLPTWKETAIMLYQINVYTYVICVIC